MVNIKLGLIPGVARQAMKDDWDGTLQRLNEMGYEGIELSLGAIEQRGISAEDARKSIESHGMEVMSLFSNWGGFDQKAQEQVECAKALGCDYMVWGWSPGEDSEQMRECLPVMHKAAGMVYEAGMQLLYHNHDHEFKNRIDDACGHDWLMAKFHRDLMHCELDIGWVAYGGADVAETIQKYPGRCPILHMRDIGDPDERGSFIEVGNGQLNLEAILKAGAETGGTKWAVVEHSEKMEQEAFEGLQAAADNIKAAIEKL
ncbi:MAG: sugar phosphate isomerase/epimerase family protein [Candidatus Sumerlaeota bacterium]